MTKPNNRGHWSSQLGFILAASGSAVGLGNIWKFPYITHKNGGGAFVLVYLLCVLCVGFPIMLAEIFMGKKSGRDPMGAYRYLARGSRWWPLAGAMGVLSGFVILSYYSVVSGWVLHYIWASAWGTFRGMDSAQIADYFNQFAANGTEQILYHALMMAVFFSIVVQGVKQGIERINRLFMPLLLVILVALTSYSMWEYSGMRAVTFLFNPDNFSQLSSHGVLEALGHSFFTLSLGMGAMITYGSYMRDDEGVMSGGFWIVLADVVISLLACFLIYSILFSFNEDVGAGPGLLFMTLPRLIDQMTGFAFFSSLFFVLVLFAAITSAISLLEVVVAFFHDEFKMRRSTACALSSVAIFLLGIPSALSLGPLSEVRLLGKNPFDFLDYLASNWMLPIGGFLSAIFVGWVVDEIAVRSEVARRWGALYPGWRWTLRFVTPVLVLLVILRTTGVLESLGTLISSVLST